MNTLPDAGAIERQEETMKSYRACLGLLRVLRRELGITKCPFCEHKEGNCVVHREPREQYMIR